MSDDSKLIERAAGGDGAALGDLLHLHRASVYAFALSLCGNREDAEDACQETFAYAVRRFGSVQRTGSFKAWLLRVARSAALDAMRSQRARSRRDKENGMSSDMNSEALQPETD